MKRVVVYDVEAKQVNKQSYQMIDQRNKKTDKTLLEKKQRALRTINNASILSKIVESIETLKLTDPQSDGPIVKEAVDKISSIVEEMKLDFKKDYWDWIVVQ